MKFSRVITTAELFVGTVFVFGLAPMSYFTYDNAILSLIFLAGGLPNLVLGIYYKSKERP
jgi:hypothetical protein